ncbi:hypothetical protein HED22_13125 [Thalassospira sp. HF15]|uniref:hypothetical protein n=1 Tax=Thalassospira sp. HF15 TaxID=2722755 RepID=UPI0014315EA2|nr:hypothetical protein [Thalassospira sp. HF15]NIY76586.1 hypothetical protein [Thalassospira sp. HF15]
MTKLYWLVRVKSIKTLTFLMTLLIAGLVQSPLVMAQSLETDPASPPAIQLVPGGSAFGPGGIRTANPTGFDRDFTPSARYGITLNPDANAPDDPAQYWLEFGGAPRADHGMNARIGLGYSPSPDLGFSLGPFVDLDAAAPGTVGVYQTDPFGTQRPMRPGFGHSSTGITHDAGLAGSLSYMPLEDIWIGLHGTLSRDLSTQNPEDGLLDGIDAMLGLTARYRIEF